MMKKFFLMIVIFALIGNLHAQNAGENFDVTHYEIQLWGFDFSAHTLQGEAFITFTATERAETFVLELKTLTVTDVACDLFNVDSFEQWDDQLTIHFDEPMEAGENAILDIRYGGNTFNESWGGVHWWGSNYVYNLGVGFESQPHNLGKTWFPCVDDFTDKATYSLYITVNNDMKAICGGNLINTFDNGDGTSTWYWDVPQEVATYHVSFAIGDYVKWEDTYHGIERDIPVEVYVKPGQINSVPGTFVHVKDIAAFYEECFGPYPFNRIGYVCTGQGCMEHIDNIAVTSGVITGNTTQEEYVAHELSHMYFGNQVTCSTAGDMWLNEGFAQFVGMFYRAGVYGEANFQEEIKKTINTITSWCNAESNWIPLNNMPLDMTYDTKAVYERGAVVVNTMMNYLGRETFLDGLRHYLENYNYGAATSEQLRDVLTEATGIDMNGFFDTYVFCGGMPHYEVNIDNITQSGDQYEAQIRMTYQHVGPSHVGQNNRVEVTFVSADGQLQTEKICWDGLESEQTVSLDFAPVAAFADYYDHYLDAKFDENLMAKEPENLAINKFKINVGNVTDSVMIRLEEHLVGPDNDPEIPALTISTRHYWNVLRQDFGDASVSGILTFNLNSDGDIIETANDSAVLLYRSNPLEPWHTIPYSFQGQWKNGKFDFDNLQTGQYTIGAIDKELYDVNDFCEKHPSLFPNPANDFVTLQWGGPDNGCVKVYNQQLQLVKSIPYRNSDKLTFNVNDLAAGIYFVENHRILQKLVIQ
ncbi:MAG: T9SS type A sorting domain-containing protein [Bacteroidales bacterium]|nr:T9SS type A sorting domain-containing protein [Bacteroidales bacterium]